MSELKFSSYEEAMTYLANITNKRIAIAEDNEIDINKVIDFFVNNQNPNDEAVHKFAEENNYNPHKLETEIYKLATKYANFINSGLANKKGIKKEDVD